MRWHLQQQSNSITRTASEKLLAAVAIEAMILRCADREWPLLSAVTELYTTQAAASP